MSQRNVDAVRAVYERWGRGDFEAGLDVFDSDVVFLLPPQFPDPGEYRGVEQIAEYMRGFLEPWSHIAIEAEEIIDAGSDRVVAAIRQHGTGTGSGIETEFRYFQTWVFRGPKVIRLENSRERPSVIDEGSD